jgi:hypothetical protein
LRIKAEDFKFEIEIQSGRELRKEEKTDRVPE